MRGRGSSFDPHDTKSIPRTTSDWQTLGRLVPYLMQYKWRVMAALAFVLCAKIANVGVPILLKHLVDALSIKPGDAAAILVVPLGLLFAYGLLRLSTSLFTELRELVFAKATQGAARSIALTTFQHLHGLSLRFHLERQTGGMTRDIERGVKGVESLISYSLYSIFPTFVEVALVLGILAVKFDAWFFWITVAALVLYVTFTVSMTEWRTRFRREANMADSTAHTKAIDSLLNYETVKYFNNEAFESRRYDESLEKLRAARLKSQTTLSLLNAGQQLIIATALVAMLWRATQGVVDGRLTLGDLVMINAFMIQLYIPLNFLGAIYREIKQSLTDLDRMFTLMDKEREVADKPGSTDLACSASPTVRFEDVQFAYEPARQILHGVSFEIPAGKTVAVVGPSGSGKSTLARLLFRFYDVQEGRITIDGQDIREVTQSSVRRAIGIVPQDTVLFNDTIAYNIAYGRAGATREEIEAAAKAARIHDFIVSTPKGYDTMVGERGLKLSGGEKQRVAIARTLLKNPPILIFDEATSALDSANERAIQNELRSAAQNKTALVIAHRLSTVVEAHEIIVMDAGRILERGTHAQLLALNGRYARMWTLQRESQDSKDSKDSKEKSGDAESSSEPLSAVSA
ncbi:ABC transporter ATP-binding protein/permease [Diaphorobacter sp. HDW4B]|uniref:ABCB family ABC transporter ATP-binding protein/permease n=1 Tax=Diaphorobacter sp. HDW4B TaxID=2714925 RepID=UPI001408D334|nr:ABC transporter ATP-binding protein/permease [Diaphorobacter sp. HDW4B]QIL70203.1 ABC transporter ATP-binding protein/permease [Diaphorobacter sp. HDW4B]